MPPIHDRLPWDEFADLGAAIARWGAEYHRTLGDRPVRPAVVPGALARQLPPAPPEAGEGMAPILADLDRLILPGLTHWQHPRFFAYFPANAAPPSMLAEFVTAILAPQCMLWQTSPAATELEVQVMDWLGQAVGLPAGFRGVIQDSASTATLAAVLTMRERALGWAGLEQGLAGGPRLRIYASDECHSSVERAVRLAGIGSANLVRIPTAGPRRGMQPTALAAAIRADRAAGHVPAGLVACTGGTGTGACDDLAAVLPLARAEGLYTHVDAAWAGAAMICPEHRALWAGVEGADSVVLNPHKWLGAQFDCSAQFLADPGPQIRTLSMKPAYLQTPGAEGVTDFSDWSLPLGRRFRALKLWVLLRFYGLETLRGMIRDHVAWSQALAARLAGDPRFEIVTEPVLSLFTFRLAGRDDAAHLAFVQRVNDDGRIYVTQGAVEGRTVVRFQVGSFAATEADVALAGDVLCDLAAA